MTTPVPTFCRLEYWNTATSSWSVRHAGIALLHPQRYVERLAGRGRIGRVTLVDSGKVLQQPCTTCHQQHDPPWGSCLI